MSEALKEFAKQYGPFAFGIFSLLIIWVAVVTPVLESSKLDFETQRAVIESQNKTLDALRSTLKDQERLSNNMQQAAEILRQTLINVKEERENVESAAP